MDQGNAWVRVKQHFREEQPKFVSFSLRGKGELQIFTDGSQQISTL